MSGYLNENLHLFNVDKVGDVFCQQSEELNDLELEATGSFWLKSTGQVCQSSVQMTLPSKEEFAKDSLDALTNTEGKTTKSRFLFV